MSDMAVVTTMPPNMWMPVGGIWVHITPLDDPLLCAALHRVTVHRRGEHAWVETVGNCAAVRWQTVPPDSYDFADIDGDRP